MKKVYLFLPEGFEETEAVTAVDVLRRGGVSTQTVSLSNDHIVKGAHNLSVKADLLFCHVEGDDTADMLVLPGGPGHARYKHHTALLNMLRGYHARGKLLAAICAAPAVLGSLGMLSGKKAVCYPGYEDELTGAIFTDANVVISGGVITSKGPGTAAEFSLKLLELLAGRETAEETAQGFIFGDLPRIPADYS